MGKVRDTLKEWGVDYIPDPSMRQMWWEISTACDADAAELAAKDKRIAELEAERASALAIVSKANHGMDAFTNLAPTVQWLIDRGKEHVKTICTRDKRIAALEAELAKRKELPPLPESVRTWIDRSRLSRIAAGTVVRDLLDWVDTHYPKPLPQWELDAREVETIATAPGVDVKAIAARIREAHNGK